MENNQEPQLRTQKERNRMLIAGLVVGLPTVFFGTKYAIKKLKQKFKKAKNDNTNQTPPDLDIKIPVQSSSSNFTRPSLPASNAGNAFPLRLGAKGNNVLALQHALMRSYGPGIFPKFGADGQFGTELSDTLKSKGYHVPLPEEEFKKIVSAQQPAQGLITFDPAAIAKGIRNAIIARDFSSALTLLKSIGNTANYSLVSKKMLEMLINGVHQNLLNAMLNSFPLPQQKVQSEAVFKKIGLKQNELTKKWSLNGYKH